MEKVREFQKNIYFCFLDYAKAFDCVDHKKLWKILQEMGISDHMICLMRHLYAGQEATVRTGHGTIDWFQIRKGVHQGHILSPCLFNLYAEFSSVQFSRSVISNYLRPHESLHTRSPCPLPTPRVHSDSCPSSQWCHAAISSSVVPFSSCPQSLPASESFSMSQLFTWGGQSTGVSALVSFLPKKSQGWSPSEWTGWICLQSKGLASLLQYYNSKASILRRSAFFRVQLSHPYMTTGKTIDDYMDLC